MNANRGQVGRETQIPPVSENSPSNLEAPPLETFADGSMPFGLLPSFARSKAAYSVGFGDGAQNWLRVRFIPDFSY